MKSMALLIDTNVVLDWLMSRQPFVKESKEVMELCLCGKMTGYLVCHSIPNILYIIRKDFSVSERKEIGLMLCEKFNIIGIDKRKVVEALVNEAWDDLEDGLQIECAYEVNADYIITRDPKGFVSSKVKSLSPKDFMNL
ncbi:MAG: PIN domain-containing protein [Oscillospiraceae bacterium]|nr:PIN domain-containing protein [Oscillospiraceae bacterium]MCL2279868.1 PIN domain-containing protein [Oscillospiraceae bacterium]